MLFNRNAGLAICPNNLSIWPTMWKTLCALALAISFSPWTPALAEGEHKLRDLTCEICRKNNPDGSPCKAKVTRGSTTPAGIHYTCANGHSFTVPPKVRIR